jgi:hypothetical protein
MKRLSLNVQTLYADLLQRTVPGASVPATISRRTIKGTVYLYAERRDGARKDQVYLGPEADAAVAERAAAIRHEAELAKQRRKSITMLKAAGLQGPSLEVGRVLDAVSRAGLFETGLVLVGTIAYQLYAAMLGCELDRAAAMTQDADFVAATINVGLTAPADEGETALDMLAILRRADPTFRPAPTLSRKALPSRFTTDGGLDVELLTPVRKRGEEPPISLPAIHAGAVPLQFLEYLVEDALPAVVLHGSGVRVRVPQPSRYAVHKLIVAQLRKLDNGKRDKDLLQARSLMQAFDETDPDALEDALEDARSRGPKWKGHVDAGLRLIGRA